MPARKTCTDSPGMRRVQAVLMESDEPMSIDDLAAAAHLSRGTLQHYRKDLLAERLIHLADYRKPHHGSPIPLYAAGPGVGAHPVRPPRYWASESERAKAYRVRMGRSRRMVLRAHANGSSMLSVLAKLAVVGEKP